MTNHRLTSLIDCNKTITKIGIWMESAAHQEQAKQEQEELISVYHNNNRVQARDRSVVQLVARQNTAYSAIQIIATWSLLTDELDYQSRTWCRTLAPVISTRSHRCVNYWGKSGRAIINLDARNNCIIEDNHILAYILDCGAMSWSISAVCLLFQICLSL